MRPSWGLAVLAAVLATGVPGRAAGPDRLPDDTEPASYALSVEPEPAAGTFAGQAVIGIRVKVTTTAIVLNARDLDVSDVSVTDKATGRDIALRSWHRAPGRERVTVDVDGHVLADREYAVRIRFGGRFRDDATGFFSTSYSTSGTDEKKWVRFGGLLSNTRSLARLCGTGPRVVDRVRNRSRARKTDFQIVKKKNQ